MLEIQFAEIPEEGLALKIDDVSWFPDREMARSGDLRVEVFLERSGAMVLVRGSIEVNLALVCDRCLEEFGRPERIDFRLILELAPTIDDGEEMEAEEYSSSRNETEVVLVDRPVVDLADLLYQQLILSLPRKNLCRPDCLGLCAACGANLNREGCDCSKISAAAPLGALGRLLKDKN